MIVRESLFEFQKTGNPMGDLNLGKYNLRDFIFPDEESFADYIISVIPYILGTSEIPYDIINQNGKYIRDEYFTKIRKFLEEREIRDQKSGDFRWNLKIPLEVLKVKLESMGFKK